MLLRLPDTTTAVLTGGEITLSQSLSFNGGFVSYKLGDGLTVRVRSQTEGISFLYLKWNKFTDTGAKVLGDAWERGYGNLEWKSISESGAMPWYMAISNGSDSSLDYKGRFTECFGIGTQPNAMAHWRLDADSITLCLDLRCGCKPVLLGERELEVGTVYFSEYRDVSAFSAIRSFCRVMSPSPLLPPHTVYGSNNWYYAYGKSSHEDILADSRFVADACRGLENKPYMVIDDGWQKNSCDAPWDVGNERFPDMRRLAEEMTHIGVRPGIWVRYLINGKDNKSRKIDTLPEEWYSERSRFVLDPSHPGVLNYVKETTRRLVDWGYTLIKHDFSTFDIFGIWGFETKELLANGEWSFYDKTKTTAEIIKQLYRTVKDAAGNTVIIGCNAIGHLCAGLHEFNRTGDDTSGRNWAQTKKMGVNTLAFRIAQNNAFFGADADCVGILGMIDWKYNSQWLKLLSESGSCLFVSCKPGILNEEEMEDLRRGFAAGSYQKDELIPLDWMETRTPTKYLINGNLTQFDWD